MARFATPILDVVFSPDGTPELIYFAEDVGERTQTRSWMRPRGSVPQMLEHHSRLVTPPEPVDLTAVPLGAADGGWRSFVA